MSYHIETKCIYGNGDRVGVDTSGALSFPIYQSATFARPDLGMGSDYDYSRLQNPTREQLEYIVRDLENGFDAIAFSSGMAAIATLMELFTPGDHLIVDADLYGGSHRIFQHISQKNGIAITKVDCSVLSLAEIEALIQTNTKAIFVETPTNPMMHIIDIVGLGHITKKHELLLIVDNTFLTPYFQNPLDLGADIVVHSGTKFLGGHNDTIAGFLVVASEELSEKVRFILKTVGNNLAPFDAWLIMRGIKTLALRMEAAQKNARAIVDFLVDNPHVKKVYYPGLEFHPGHELSKKQARGFGSMITFEVESEQMARDLLRNLKLIKFAESLGGVESLMTYPITQTHADVSPEDLAANGITHSVLRLSVGIENVDDLLADLKQALA